MEAAKFGIGGCGGGRAEELVLNSFVVVFSPVLPTRFIPGRMRQPSDDARTASIMLGSRLKSPREKAAWRWGARGRKRARRRENVRNSVWLFGLGTRKCR